MAGERPLLKSLAGSVLVEGGSTNGFTRSSVGLSNEWTGGSTRVELYRTPYLRNPTSVTELVGVELLAA